MVRAACRDKVVFSPFVGRYFHIVDFIFFPLVGISDLIVNYNDCGPMLFATVHARAMYTAYRHHVWGHV